MDIAKVLKGEITRIARKELRSASQNLKKSSALYRREIASLKRQVLALESALRRLAKASTAKAPERERSPEEPVVRFSAKGFGAHRERLALSASEMASLLGVSSQSVYHWEQGKSRPRASQMPAISAVRKMGKREASYRLSVMKG
jgi:DNA-binding transcriptional regulator YiaG